jgi:hypothetical protein
LDRSKALEVLDALAESAAVDPAKIRDAWAWRQKNFGERYLKPTAEMAEDEIASFLAVRRALVVHRGGIQELLSDKDPEIAMVAASILKHLDRCREASSSTAEADRDGATAGWSCALRCRGKSDRLLVRGLQAVRRI